MNLLAKPDAWRLKHRDVSLWKWRSLMSERMTVRMLITQLPWLLSLSENPGGSFPWILVSGRLVCFSITVWFCDWSNFLFLHWLPKVPPVNLIYFSGIRYFVVNMYYNLIPHPIIDRSFSCFLFSLLQTMLMDVPVHISSRCCARVCWEVKRKCQVGGYAYLWDVAKSPSEALVPITFPPAVWESENFTFTSWYHLELLLFLPI